MNKTYLIILLTCLCLSISYSQKLNQYNKKAERTGKWLTYSDKEKTKKLFEGKYHKGLATGTCLYFTMDGILEKKEVKRFNKIKTSFFYEDGSLSHKGMARIVNTKEKIHYYFYGKWKYYNQKGELIKFGYFEKGILKKTEYLNGTSGFNDTLKNILTSLESSFAEKHKQSIDSIGFCWSNPKLAEKYRIRMYLNDSASYKKVEEVINDYGYPTKELCGDATIVPFFIISYAPLKMREKYTELFKAAAGVGSLSTVSLAFYIDKIKVEKGEKQIYGTQCFYDKDKKLVYYSIYDPENLEKRRAEMKLTD